MLCAICGEDGVDVVPWCCDAHRAEVARKVAKAREGIPEAPKAKQSKPKHKVNQNHVGIHYSVSPELADYVIAQLKL